MAEEGTNITSEKLLAFSFYIGRNFFCNIHKCSSFRLSSIRCVFTGVLHSKHKKSKAGTVEEERWPTHLDSVNHLPRFGRGVIGRAWGAAGLHVSGTALAAVCPEKAHEGVMLAGGDALAGAAGGRQAVRHTGWAALTGGFHLVHHREAGLDGWRQVAKRYLAGGGAPTRHKSRGGHPERWVSAAVAVRGLAGYGGPGGGLPQRSLWVDWCKHGCFFCSF